MIGEREHAEVLVVGAGPAGSIAAMLLARQGHDVLLVDKAEFPRDKTCGDGLTPRAVATLQRLGLEAQVAAHAHRITRAHLYAASGHVLRADFDPLVHPLPPRGYIIPRVHLDDVLRSAAIRAGASFVPRVHVVDVVREGGYVRGVVARVDGTTRIIHARVVIVAIGASLHLLRRLGIATDPPHDILAVRGYWEGVSDLDDGFEFHFAADVAPGYGWVFPVNDGVANIGVGVYRLRRGDARTAKDYLAKFLSDYAPVRERLVHARALGPVKGYPIRTDFPQQPVFGHGWLVIGEAAGLVNPATGEGIDLAMESAEWAARTVHTALSTGTPTVENLWPYAWHLYRHFEGMFRGLRWVRSIVMWPHPLDVLIRQSRRHPGLARRIIRITLGIEPAYTALLPTTWWWLLNGSRG